MSNSFFIMGKLTDEIKILEQFFGESNWPFFSN